jgi:ABC-2 type transport system ATP-binding protein
MMEKKLIIKNISKQFKIEEQENLALNKILRFLKKENKKTIQILDCISFELNQKEILGIIGRNGSGKSTLLRIIANIYKQDSGKIETKGKVFYLSGFDIGLIPKLTMKENIFLIGSILGLNKKQIKNKLEEIIEFSGLREFTNVEVNKFSSGMISRLNFSITINSLEQKKPDILLLDEVLNSSGDLNFQEKTTKKIEELLKSGISIIIVSHNLEQIKKYCDKAICLEKGKIIAYDKPEKVIEKYLSIQK